MSDLTKRLRELAGHARDNPGDTADHYAFQNAADPTTVIALLNELQTANLARTQLLAELAMYYPIAIQALATGSDESDLLELREMIDKIEKSTTAARIEYLPARLKKLGGGQ